MEGTSISMESADEGTGSDLEMETAGHETESDSETRGPPPKTRKLEGVAKYPAKFNSKWSKQWPCIQAALNYKFRCTVCECSCEHQGETDVRHHMDGKKQRDNVHALQNQRN